jgi:hypothetical protein
VSGDVLIDDEEEHGEADRFPPNLALLREHSDNAKELHIQYMAASFGVCGEEGDGEGTTRGGARSGKDGIRVFPDSIWEWLKGGGGSFALVLKVT